MTKGCKIAWFVALLSACAAKDDGAQAVSDSEYIGEDIPAGNCGETDNAPCSSSTGDAVPSSCAASSDCQGGSICAAVFDGDIGTFACRASCIDDRDDTRWCLDDAGCCNAGSVCLGRGYCVPTGGASTTATTSTTDVGSTGT